MDYHQAWTFLDQLQFFKIKLGLESMHSFLSDLGRPHKGLQCIHIGGTNGKGSVGATLLSLLDTAGYRVGFYSSPHLSSVRERFRIGTSCISRQDFARHATAIRDVLGKRRITYFEFTTTLALLWFVEQKVDLALLEVGMGGRLDATNVVTPLVSIITNVSMDHEQYLGTTLRQVAGEKAGIIKPQVPVVSGVARDESRDVITSTCQSLQAPLYLLGRDFRAWPEEKAGQGWRYEGIAPAPGQKQRKVLRNLPLQLPGDHQVENSALALATLELLAGQGFACSETQLRRGLAKARWPGRMEEFWVDAKGRIRGTRPEEPGQQVFHYLLDGAHNPAGVQALRHCLASDFSYRKLILVWAAMADKDLHKTLATIAPLAGTIIFTRPESERSATPEQLKEILRSENGQQIICEPSVETALSLAQQEAGPDDLICVAGSLYLVGRVRQLLCGDLV